MRRCVQVDLVANPQLVWLVDTLLSCPLLPAGWEKATPERIAALGLQLPAARLILLAQMRQRSWRTETFYVSHLSLTTSERHPMVQIARALTFMSAGASPAEGEEDVINAP